MENSEIFIGKSDNGPSTTQPESSIPQRVSQNLMSNETEQHTTLIPYKDWINVFTKYPILASKDTTSKAKKAARLAISDELRQIYPSTPVTESKVRKAFNNKKRLLLHKADVKKAGNTEIDLSANEKKLLELINRPDGAVASSSSSENSDYMNAHRKPAPAVLSDSKRSPGPLSSIDRTAKRSKLDNNVDSDTQQLYLEVLKEQLIYYKKKNANLETGYAEM